MKHIRFFLGLLTVLIGILKNAEYVTAGDVADLEDADVDAYGHVSLNDKESVAPEVKETVSRTTEEESKTIIEEETDKDLEESTVKIGADEVSEAPIEVTEEESYATESIPTEETTTESIPTEETTTESIPTEDTPYVEPEEKEKPFSSEPSPAKRPFSLASSSKDSIAFLKNKFTGAVERVKGLTPAEVKKAAAGALGAWGAAVGIRFALQRGG
jgi:hypothetical protein